MDNDLQTPEGLAVIFEMMTQVNKMQLNAEDAGHIIAFLQKVDSIFKMLNFEIVNVKIPPEITSLLVEREKARENKNWKRADELREEIKIKGYQINDTPDGQRVKKI